MVIPPEVNRARILARALFSDPEMMAVADALELEARRLSGDPDMGMMRALEYMAARGMIAAQAILDALDCAQVRGPERARLVKRARSKLRIVR
jgi:hypothetical protein